MFPVKEHHIVGSFRDGTRGGKTAELDIIVEIDENQFELPVLISIDLVVAFQVPDDVKERVRQKIHKKTLSTSAFEADLLYVLSEGSALKQSIKYMKLIGEKVAVRAYQNEPLFSERVPFAGVFESYRLNGADDNFRKDINKVMKYAHIFSSDDVASRFHEASKPPISLCSAPLKQLAFKAAATLPSSLRDAAEIKETYLISEVLKEIG
ncbi:hypothetical protein LSH36_757g01006 [Paralvinella palmiformis]|uniref:Uncharacterized protein n=1 Tax=Paralvinella palmiformis TaxID=53620 RepID=A0AAD9J2H0_9ANNE|nr:hypothetical protein LSH36_757g01006 [Paralvinella palmiformis]